MFTEQDVGGHDQRKKAEMVLQLKKYIYHILKMPILKQNLN